MIDDLPGQIFGEAVFGRFGESRRAQLLFRVFFGLLGAGLGLAGAWHFVFRVTDGTLATRGAMIALLLSMACFWLFNVALGRRWYWPAWSFGASFVALVVAAFAGS